MATYRDSGVNLELGDTVSEIFYNAIKKTWENRKGDIGEILEPLDSFSGVRGVDVSKLPRGTILGSNSDGIGTKVEIAERTGNHRTMAHNLIAMCAEDAARFGAEPIYFTSVFDVNSLDGNIEIVGQIVEGYVEAAKLANVAVINGETAELGNRVGGYGDFNYNWSGTVTWIARKDRLIDGSKIIKGDSLVAFREEGFRSNGFSLIRKIFEKEYGDEWHNESWSANQTLGEAVLTPSEIYTRTLVDLVGGFRGDPMAEIHGIAHITGGGIPEKIGRLLKGRGFGAYVHPFEPSGIMTYLQDLGDVSDEEAYNTWNMGQGMIVVTPDPDKVVGIAHLHGIEAGYAGKVVEGSDISILSEGRFRKHQHLYFKVS